MTSNVALISDGVVIVIDLEESGGHILQSLALTLVLLLWFTSLTLALCSQVIKAYQIITNWSW